LGGIPHESSDREDLRRKMPFKESLHDQRVVEGVLVVALREPTQDVESKVRPHHAVQRWPDRMMFVGVQPREPFPPLLAKTAQREAAFFRHIALVDVVGIAVVRHFKSRLRFA
jgi:hypothetical protein